SRELVRTSPNARSASIGAIMAGATQPSAKGEVMEQITRVGVDLAKNVMVRPESRLNFCLTGEVMT
ncbi:hypothetical protein ACV229_40465, partial [Burkholderia sp. MR1-5-21]